MGITAPRPSDQWCRLNVSGTIFFIVVFTVIVLLLPFAHYMGWGGDEGIVLDGVSRIRRGDRLYIDFFEFYPPISFWVTAAFFHIAGPSFAAVRALAIGVIALIAGFTYLSCYGASKSHVLSIWLALVWVVASQEIWTPQLSHHWFTTLLSMVAAWTALRSAEGAGGRWLAVICGLAAGCAVGSTQTRGAFTGLAALVAYGRVRPPIDRMVLYVLAAVTPVLLMIVVLALMGVAVEAYRDIILFPARRYSTVQWVPFGDGASLAVKYFYPVLFLGGAWLSIFSENGIRRNRQVYTAAAFAAAGLAGVFPRPDAVHLFYSLPLGLPFAALCLRRLLARTPTSVVVVIVVFAVWHAGVTGRSFRWRALRALGVAKVETPRGMAAFGESGVKELAEQLERYRGEQGLLYPYIPYLNYFFDIHQVSKVDVFVPYYTSGHQYREACIAAVTRARVVVIDRPWTDAQSLRRTFPAMPKAVNQDRLGLETALKGAFHVIWTNKRFEILGRNRSPDVGMCNRIDIVR